MANLSYAPAGSGPFAGAIGWVNFPASLGSNASTIVSGTLRDGSIITFTLTNTHNSGGTITFAGMTAPLAPGYPFGSGGYGGITGPVVFYSTPSAIFNNTLQFSNILVKDPSGVTIPNYTIVLCDAEITGPNETLTYTTNGGPWISLGLLGTGISPSYAGFGTTTLVLAGTSLASFRAIVSATNSPTNVNVNISESILGREAIAFGVLITKVNLSKVINNRAYSNDQFNISIATPTISSTTITTGNLNGVQSQSTSIYVTPTSVASVPVTISETMAPGSTGTIPTNYLTTVQNSNTTPGGTIVPSTGPLGETLSITFGDYILSTIVNTAITSTLISTKTVDKSSVLPGDILTYTVVLNNTGPLTIVNSTFIDTIPTGTSFVPNSVTINGVTVPGTVSPPSGLSVGTIPVGTTTISFKVTVQNLILGTSISNRATAFGNNILVPSTVTITSNSNTIASSVLGSATVSTSKIVDRNFADVGNILNYTITIINNGNTTIFNTVFIDTIPNGTSFVNNSLRQDGIIVSGNPNPPGVTLPNSIGQGRTSTVTFQVLITTIPSPNPILNSATENFQYLFNINTTTVGSGNTNTVPTTVNNANLNNIFKSSDRDYITCGGIITYLITIPNNGSTTAINVSLIDTIPNGTSLISGSVTVNGVVQIGANPSLGITIPDIGPNLSSTVSFKVQVNC